MMTLAWILLAVSVYFLWQRKATWGWSTVMLALIVGIVIFLNDVDFATDLGRQL